MTGTYPISSKNRNLTTLPTVSRPRRARCTFMTLGKDRLEGITGGPLKIVVVGLPWSGGMVVEATGKSSTQSLKFQHLHLIGGYWHHISINETDGRTE